MKRNRVDESNNERACRMIEELFERVGEVEEDYERCHKDGQPYVMSGFSSLNLRVTLLYVELGCDKYN